MRYLLALIYTVFLAVIINIFAILFDESYVNIAVHFLIGAVAGIAANTSKEDN